MTEEDRKTFFCQLVWDQIGYETTKHFKNISSFLEPLNSSEPKTDQNCQFKQVEDLKKCLDKCEYDFLLNEMECGNYEAQIEFLRSWLAETFEPLGNLSNSLSSVTTEVDDIPDAISHFPLYVQSKPTSLSDQLVFDFLKTHLESKRLHLIGVDKALTGVERMSVEAVSILIWLVTLLSNEKQKFKEIRNCIDDLCANSPESSISDLSKSFSTKSVNSSLHYGSAFLSVDSERSICKFNKIMDAIKLAIRSSRFTDDFAQLDSDNVDTLQNAIDRIQQQKNFIREAVDETSTFMSILHSQLAGLQCEVFLGVKAHPILIDSSLYELQVFNTTNLSQLKNRCKQLLKQHAALEANEQKNDNFERKIWIWYLTDANRIQAEIAKRMQR